MNRPLIYVAGPYRGAVEANVARAVEYARDVIAAGAIPVIPHSLYRPLDGEYPDEWFLSSLLEIMRRCDAVYLTDEWEHSAGTRAEILDAHSRGLPVLVDREAMARWVTLSVL